MSMYTCPANHASETPEFCSVCGLEIPGGAPGAAATQSLAEVIEILPVAPSLEGAGGHVCPDCGAPRDSDRQVFCEVCGYNFATRTAGAGPPPGYVPAPAAKDPPAEAAAAHIARPASAPLDGPSPTPAAAGPALPGDAACWELVVTVDPNLYGAPNPDAPADQPPQKFRLFDRETMIGRAGTEVRVHVPVHGDPGVSRRQALLIQCPDGSLVLRDLNSANGTRVDGVDVLPGVDTLLRDGAAIAVGGWTSIVVHAIGP